MVIQNKINLNIHIVSDSSGETALYVSEAAYKQFNNLEVKEYIWPLVRSQEQVDEVILAAQKAPGPIIYTMINNENKKYLIDQCEIYNIKNICPLDSVLDIISNTTGLIPDRMLPGKHSSLDEGYFKKINSINFTLSHDDGGNRENYENADILILGISRTSKTPTSFYLAHRGYKTANLPIIEYNDTEFDIQIQNKNINKYADINNLKNPLVVGLTISPEILYVIRSNRVENEILPESNITSRLDFNNYLSLEEIKNEISYAKRVFNKLQIPIIDVTQKAVEEVAGEIIKLYLQHKKYK